jgi:hypothetical protein
MARETIITYLHIFFFLLGSTILYTPSILFLLSPLTF